MLQIDERFTNYFLAPCFKAYILASKRYISDYRTVVSD